MMLSMIEQFLVVSFAGLLIWAATSDIHNLVIPNRVSTAVAGLWLAWAAARLAGGSLVGPLVLSAGLGAGAFALGAALFAMRFVGGGDVKLFAAVTLWAGPGLAMPFLFLTLLAGGVLALSVLLFRFTRNLMMQPAAGAPVLAVSVALMSALKSTVPFGMAISVGGLFVAYRLFFGDILF